MFQQVFEQAIRKTVLISPSSIAKYALKLFGVCTLNLAEGFYNCYPYILRHSPHVIPVIPFRNNKGMDLLFVEISRILSVLLFYLLRLFIIYVTNPFEEQEGKYVLLICSGINTGPQKNCRVPQIGLELFKADPLAHAHTLPPKEVSSFYPLQQASLHMLQSTVAEPPRAAQSPEPFSQYSY